MPSGERGIPNRQCETKFGLGLLTATELAGVIDMRGETTNSYAQRRFQFRLRVVFKKTQKSCRQMLGAFLLDVAGNHD